MESAADCPSVESDKFINEMWNPVSSGLDGALIFVGNSFFFPVGLEEWIGLESNPRGANLLLRSDAEGLVTSKETDASSSWML
jgi:hypothetical protein